MQRFQTLGLNDIEAATLTVLAWLSAADGSIDESESSLLCRIAHSWNIKLDADVFSSLRSEANDSQLSESFHFLRSSLSPNHRLAFLESAIALAAVDGKLHAIENHCLRFISDLVGVSEVDFASSFQRITGRTLPPCSDPSRASFWGRDPNPGKVHNKEQRDPTADALAVLGLSAAATQKEIRTAYLILAKENHPDRFHAVGKVAVEAANTRFLRIKDAYDLLSRQHA